MRYRYLVEFGVDDIVVLSTITAEDTSGTTVSTALTVDEARALAAKCESEDVLWQLAPKAWRPDAIVVSQWFDDGADDKR